MRSSSPGVTLLEDRDDLGLAELRLLHGTSWLKRCQKALLLGCAESGGAYGTLAGTIDRSYRHGNRGVFLNSLLESF